MGRRPVVLDEDAETLERSEHRAVDDDGMVLLVVGADVREAEAHRHLIVELDRPICQERPSESVMCRSIFGP